MRIRIANFGGLQPNIDARQLPDSGAQVAHNCLLVDGSLQALPQWQQLLASATSIGPAQTNLPYTVFDGYFGLAFYGAPFGRQVISVNPSGQVQPSIACSATAYSHTTASGLSSKAVNRVYGVTALITVGGVVYESPITLSASSDPTQVMYEGDYVTLTASGTGQMINIYRSTSDVTTGSGANGAVTANWQLVAQLAGTNGVYVDGGTPTDTPYDTYLPRGPLTPPFYAAAMGLLEGGWVWIVSPSGDIALSDRYAWGYWPVENIYNLGAESGTTGITMTGAASTGDRLFIGTQTGVFIGSVEPTGEGGVVMQLARIPGAEPCIPNTMVSTPNGAMYCCQNGIMSLTMPLHGEGAVMLSGKGATMLTRGIARGVAGILPNGTQLRFDQMRNAIYHNGRYIALGGLIA